MTCKLFSIFRILSLKELYFDSFVIWNFYLLIFEPYLKKENRRSHKRSKMMQSMLTCARYEMKEIEENPDNF